MRRSVILAVLFFIVASCSDCGRSCASCGASCTGPQSCEQCITRCQSDFSVSRDACIAGYCKTVCPQ